MLLKNEPVHPFGLAVYGDYIFWTDWVRRAVLRADKYTGGDMKVLRADIPQQPMGIVAVANDTNNCTYQWWQTVQGLREKKKKKRRSGIFAENAWRRC